MELGLTPITAAVAPVDHKYVEPPLAFRIAELPTHTVADVAVMVGKALTVIVPVAET